MMHIVVARYNEPWVNVVQLYGLFAKTFSSKHHIKLFVYNKGAEECDDDTIRNIATIVKLPNVGRETHTYLYHIYENYHDLADFTVFAMASWVNVKEKVMLIQNILTRVHIIPCITFTYGVSFNEIYDFTIDEWCGTCKENATTVKSMEFTRSSVRPFGAWFQKTIKVPYVCASLFGIFSVWQQRIMLHSRDTYKAWLDELCDGGTNPELSHYWERSWLSVFTPNPTPT